MSTVVTVKQQQQLQNHNYRCALFEGRRQHHVGDVLFVKRSLRRLRGRHTCYHHTGVVTEVNNDSSIAAVLHFDPVFDSARELNAETLRLAISGCYGPPRLLEGFDQINSKFPEDETFTFHPGSIEHEADIRRQIQDATGDRLYLLLVYNCQSFAMEISTGIAWSKDLSSFMKAIKDFGECFGEVAAYSWEASAPLRNFQLIKSDSLVPRVVNAVVMAFIVILIILLILVVAFTSASVAGFRSFFQNVEATEHGHCHERERNQQVQ